MSIYIYIYIHTYIYTYIYIYIHTEACGASPGRRPSCFAVLLLRYLWLICVLCMFAMLLFKVWLDYLYCLLFHGLSCLATGCPYLHRPTAVTPCGRPLLLRSLRRGGVRRNGSGRGGYEISVITHHDRFSGIQQIVKNNAAMSCYIKKTKTKNKKR